MNSLKLNRLFIVVICNQSMLPLVNDLTKIGVNIMTDQKAKLIHVLNQCQFKKSFQERRKLDVMINQVCQDGVTLYDIKHHSDYIHVTLWTNNNDLITIAFFDDNHIILCLSCGCDYRMFNDSDNIQYDEIKSLLLKDNNQ